MTDDYEWDYETRIEVLSAAKRNELQLHMRNYNMNTAYQLRAEKIRAIVADALQELSQIGL